MVRPKVLKSKNSPVTASKTTATNSQTSSQRKKRKHRHDDSTRLRKRAEKEAEKSAAIGRIDSEKISRKRITLKRKLGLYATGKLSSTVWKEYCEREENAARANEDLKKIVRLAESRPLTTENVKQMPSDDRLMSGSRLHRFCSRRPKAQKERETLLDGSSSDDDVSYEPQNRPTIPSSSQSSFLSSLSQIREDSMGSSSDGRSLRLESPSEGDEFEEIARAVNEELSTVMKSLFPQDEDIVVSVCHYLQRMPCTMSANRNARKDQLFFEEDRSSEFRSGREDSVYEGSKSTSDRSRCERGNTLDLSGDLRTPTGSGRVVGHRVQTERAREPFIGSRMATTSSARDMADPRGVPFDSTVASFSPQTFYNRQRASPRLQSVPDTAELPPLSPMRRVRLIEASPDSDGAPSFQPQMLAAAIPPTMTLDLGGPVYFRHKLY